MTSCHWCALVRSGRYCLEQTPGFVVLKADAPRCSNVTLVPREHVSVLTDLPGPEMALVLAGLSRTSNALRQEEGPCGVEVRAHPAGTSAQGGHLHFHLVPQPLDERATGKARAEGPSVFASLAQAISR
ncbi:MAG: HIT family protein [Acidimicrobiales bacterium]